MRTRKSAAQWGELVSAWEASGLTAEAFASERGVAEATLRWWKTELARRARNEPRRRPPSSARQEVSGIALARVVRPGEEAARARLSGGVCVRAGGAPNVVDQGIHGGLLPEVDRALQETR